MTESEMFKLGQQDCQSGKPHQHNMGREYDRGYDIEELRQEVITDTTSRHQERSDHAGQ